MTAPRRRRIGKRSTTLSFETISIEGGLLSPDWLARAAQLKAGQQSEADYRIPKGLNLRDEIGRYWRIAEAHWHDFAKGHASGGNAQKLAERFVLALLQDSFGFASLEPVVPQAINERIYPIGFAALGGRGPLVIAPAGSGLDTPSPAFGEGGRRRSAFGLAQEYLNAADLALWGLTCDGLTLRILRDNGSMTRPSWIEADLGRIFAEERYADFAALWLIAHETRFGRPDHPVTECALEAWREAGRAEGTRARQYLRANVEDALLALGRGFLAHPENAALRAALHDGSLAKEEYFQQLLRLVYRLIFLLTVEERGLIHPDGSSEAAKALYADGYGMGRLRERAVRRSAHDRFSDLWEATKIVFRGAAAGEPRLALPALAGIFAASQCPALDASKLENRALLTAVFRLSWLKEATGLSRVNWRDMGPEELGSVYESLLELVPRVTEDCRSFAFATSGETKGNARKMSGSYYTPDSLVQILLDSALEPVVESTIAASPEDPAAALLRLSVVDPACGSGHFLLAAARRLAGHVARLEANGTPSAAEYRSALRKVVGHCIYGVDLNPLAVELCKVSLWMEAVEPGLPLTFLNSHIRHGNALLGTTPELMAKGIPDAAWDPIEGDDKKTASALKKRNKAEATGQRTFDSLWESPSDRESVTVTRAMTALEAASDADPDALAQKEADWVGILDSEAYRHQKLVADTWCAAFVWPKQPGDYREGAPTDEVWRKVRDAVHDVREVTVETTEALAKQYSFFHWHLAFPHIIKRGGFDVALGNPPWERVKIQEQEFFASRNGEIASAPNAAARKKLIAALPTANPLLASEWMAASRIAEGYSYFVRKSGRFPLCGGGDINTYALFAEHNRALIHTSGHAGFIAPSGIATDDNTKEYFSALVDADQLISLFDFQSGPGLFGDIGHARFKFALITLGPHRGPSLLVFFARSVQDLGDSSRHVLLAKEDFSLLNPNTKNCPTFRTSRDADLVKGIYQRVPVLVREGVEVSDSWDLTIRRQLDMNRPETLSLCSTVKSENSLPVFEAKLMHQFDHRFGDYADKKAGSASTSLPDVSEASRRDPRFSVQPRYWIDADRVAEKLFGFWSRGWLLAWRDICRSFDERTVIASIIPMAGTDFTLRIASVRRLNTALDLLATFNSFVLDYVSRQKLGGTHLSDYISKQLPVPGPSFFSNQACRWERSLSISHWILPRALELTYTSWDIEAFARDYGYEGPPFRWDLDRRFLLRTELDAAFFHLYGISHDDADYILDTFPIVRKDDEKAHGEYRTKRVILEIYDEMAEAARTGVPYRTRLDPPPADPRVAHPDIRGGAE